MAQGAAPTSGTPSGTGTPSGASPAPPTPEQKYGPKLPKSVADGARAADELIRAQTAPPEPQDGEEPPQATPAAPAPPTPAHEAPQPPPGPPQEDTWEQRARSALGRLEAATGTIQQQNQRIAHLENLLSTMEASGRQQPQPETQPPQPLALVTQEERDEWGEPMLDMIGKRAQEAINPEISELKASLAAIQTQLKGVGTVIARNEVRSVYETLDSAVPQWKEINRSQDFKDWASQIEPYSGIPRNTLIRQAFDRHEGERVVTFFKGYLSEAAALDPANHQPGSGTAPSPNGQAGNGKIPLEHFAAPGRARSAPAETPPEKPVYTRAWISQFWATKLKGAYKGREAEADAIERDIFAAGNEGRIR